MSLDPSSRARLNRRHVALFPGETLFARIARVVCEAECLPRKELFESWETARRVRRRFHGGNIRDLAAGHGLLAAMLLILDDRSPEATCVDVRRPDSCERLWTALRGTWPRLDGRLRYVVGEMESLPPVPEELVVSAHACGALTDAVLERAIANRSPVAVLPCCHELLTESPPVLAGWMDGPLAIDAERAMRLVHAGFEVWTQAIPSEITPKNRLLLGRPRG